MEQEQELHFFLTNLGTTTITHPDVVHLLRILSEHNLRFFPRQRPKVFIESPGVVEQPVHWHHKVLIPVSVLFKGTGDFRPRTLGKESVTVKRQYPSSTNSVTTVQDGMVTTAIVVHDVLVLVVVRRVQDTETGCVAVFQEFPRAEVVWSREVFQTEIAANVFLVSEGYADVLLAVSGEQVHDFTFHGWVYDTVQEPPFLGVGKVGFVVENKLKVGIGLPDTMSRRQVVAWEEREIC